jgi:hypothetical protein
LNELSEKFGYTIKTFNLLGIVLMIQGEIKKASEIFENVLKEYNVYELGDGDSLLAPTNQDLACLIYNYIKCNAMVNGHNSMVLEGYRLAGLQTFLRGDDLSIKLFMVL